MLFRSWSLEDILAHPYELWQEVSSKCKPVALFKEYLEKGYYPFLLEGEGEYYTKIEQVVNYIIETELPRICKVDVANVRKLQALIALICSEVPFELNANRIAAALEIGRDTVVEYLKYLGDAKVLNLLYSDKKKIGKLTKPDKVYLENPNILYALAPTKVDIGTLRETFAIGSLAESHNVEYGKAQGDFKVDGKYTFEIGGRSKDFSQIAGVKDSYLDLSDVNASAIVFTIGTQNFISKCFANYYELRAGFLDGATGEDGYVKFSASMIPTIVFGQVLRLFIEVTSSTSVGNFRDDFMVDIIPKIELTFGGTHIRLDFDVGVMQEKNNDVKTIGLYVMTSL